MSYEENKCIRETVAFLIQGAINDIISAQRRLTVVQHFNNIRSANVATDTSESEKHLARAIELLATVCPST